MQVLPLATGEARTANAMRLISITIIHSPAATVPRKNRRTEKGENKVWLLPSPFSCDLLRHDRSVMVAGGD